MLDFEKVDKMVENCKKLYPDIPDYCLWVLACDYYLKEGREDGDDDDDDILALEGSPARREKARAREEETINRKKEALEAYEKAKKELETTNYETIQIV